MDEMNILLDEQIRYLTNKMAELEPGSTEYTSAAKALAELYKARVDEDKVRTEDDRNAVISKKDKALKIAELVLGGIGTALTAACFIVGLKFEETGSVGSFFNKQLFPKIFRKK